MLYTMRDLNRLSNKELEDFFKSFDFVLSDVNGVLWNILTEIPGANTAVRSLQKYGKRVVLVTNNGHTSTDVFSAHLKSCGFEVEENDIVTPTLSFISYLEKHNLSNKKVFAIGSDAFKRALNEAGFDVVEDEPFKKIETFKDFMTKAISDYEVGAVVVDLDINLNYLKLQRAYSFLEGKNPIFLCGCTDLVGPSGLGLVIGPANFLQILENMCGRKAVCMGKSGHHLIEVINAKYGIKDSKRVVFISDSISGDMKFASQGGYQKLLVLSGTAKKENLENWSFPEDCKPDFYVESLADVGNLIQRSQILE